MKTFAQWMDEALYGGNGYYSSSRAKTGRAGDYFTAPETGPAFGALLATIFQEWLTRLKADTLLEVGAGEGHLAAPLSRVGRYIAVERSDSRRKKLQTLDPQLITYPTLSDVKPFEGIIFANELLDAFPVHRVKMREGGLKEAYIKEGASVLEWGVPSTPRLIAYFERLRLELPEGYETEVNLAMADWLGHAASVLQRGLVVLIDYGRPAWDYYAQERNGGTLRGFKNHQFMEPLNAQGDLTADVDFTSAALDAQAVGLVPLAFMDLGAFLSVGLRPDTPKQGLTYLLRPDGLGAQFGVLILGKGVHSADWFFEHNRLNRLGTSFVKK